jgi:hypothetical protein
VNRWAKVCETRCDSDGVRNNPGTIVRIEMKETAFRAVSGNQECCFAAEDPIDGHAENVGKTIGLGACRDAFGLADRNPSDSAR